MGPFVAMVKANLKMTVRNRQALFWNLAFPALFIIIFGYLFGNTNSVSFTVSVVGAQTPLQTQTTQALKSSKAFKVKTGTQEHELKELKDGNRDLVIVFAPQANGQPPAVKLYYDESNGQNGQIAASAVTQIVQGLTGGEQKVAITSAPVNGDHMSYIDFFVPGMLGYSLMNAGVIGLSTAFVTYRERGVLRRIKVTPFPLWQFISARVASQILVAVAQAVILVALAKALFGLTIEGNLFVVLVGIIFGALAFLAMGFAISGFSKNAEVAASYANLITFPMLFISGVFFPISSMPDWLIPITKVMPLKYAVNALRDPMSKGLGFGSTWVDLLALLITFLISMFIAVRYFRWEARSV